MAAAPGRATKEVCGPAAPSLEGAEKRIQNYSKAYDKEATGKSPLQKTIDASRKVVNEGYGDDMFKNNGKSRAAIAAVKAQLKSGKITQSQATVASTKILNNFERERVRVRGAQAHSAEISKGVQSAGRVVTVAGSAIGGTIVAGPLGGIAAAAVAGSAYDAATELDKGSARFSHQFDVSNSVGGVTARLIKGEKVNGGDWARGAAGSGMDAMSGAFAGGGMLSAKAAQTALLTAAKRTGVKVSLTAMAKAAALSNVRTSVVQTAATTGYKTLTIFGDRSLSAKERGQLVRQNFKETVKRAPFDIASGAAMAFVGVKVQLPHKVADGVLQYGMDVASNGAQKSLENFMGGKGAGLSTEDMASVLTQSAGGTLHNMVQRVPNGQRNGGGNGALRPSASASNATLKGRASTGPTVPQAQPKNSVANSQIRAAVKPVRTAKTTDGRVRLQTPGGQPATLDQVAQGLANRTIKPSQLKQAGFSDLAIAGVTKQAAAINAACASLQRASTGSPAGRPATNSQVPSQSRASTNGSFNTLTARAPSSGASPQPQPQAGAHTVKIAKQVKLAERLPNLPLQGFAVGKAPMPKTGTRSSSHRAIEPIKGTRTVSTTEPPNGSTRAASTIRPVTMANGSLRLAKGNGQPATINEVTQAVADGRMTTHQLRQTRFGEAAIEGVVRDAGTLRSSARAQTAPTPTPAPALINAGKGSKIPDDMIAEIHRTLKSPEFQSRLAQSNSPGEIRRQNDAIRAMRSDNKVTASHHQPESDHSSQPAAHNEPQLQRQPKVDNPTAAETRFAENPGTQPQWNVKPSRSEGHRKPSNPLNELADSGKTQDVKLAEPQGGDRTAAPLRSEPPAEPNRSSPPVPLINSKLSKKSGITWLRNLRDVPLENERSQTKDADAEQMKLMSQLRTLSNEQFERTIFNAPSSFRKNMLSPVIQEFERRGYMFRGDMRSPTEVSAAGGFTIANKSGAVDAPMNMHDHLFNFMSTRSLVSEGFGRNGRSASVYDVEQPDGSMKEVQYRPQFGKRGYTYIVRPAFESDLKLSPRNLEAYDVSSRTEMKGPYDFYANVLPGIEVSNLGLQNSSIGADLNELDLRYIKADQLRQLGDAVIVNESEVRSVRDIPRVQIVGSFQNAEGHYSKASEEKFRIGTFEPFEPRIGENGVKYSRGGEIVRLQSSPAPVSSPSVDKLPQK